MNQENNLARKYDDLENSPSLGHIKEYVDYCNFHINEGLTSLKGIRQNCENYTQSTKDIFNSILEVQVNAEKQSVSLNNVFEEALEYSKTGQKILTSHFSKTLTSKISMLQNEISRATSLSSSLQGYVHTLQKSLDSANELSIQIASYLTLTKDIIAEGGFNSDESVLVIENIRSSIAKSQSVIAMIKSFLSHSQHIASSAFVVLKKMELLIEDAIKTNNIVSGFNS